MHPVSGQCGALGGVTVQHGGTPRFLCRALGKLYSLLILGSFVVVTKRLDTCLLIISLFEKKWQNLIPWTKIKPVSKLEAVVG